MKAWLETEGPPTQRELVGVLHAVLEMQPLVSFSAASLTDSLAFYCFKHDLATTFARDAKAASENLADALIFLFNSLFDHFESNSWVRC